MECGVDNWDLNICASRNDLLKWLTIIIMRHSHTLPISKFRKSNQSKLRSLVSDIANSLQNFTRDRADFISRAILYFVSDLRINNGDEINNQILYCIIMGFKESFSRTIPACNNDGTELFKALLKLLFPEPFILCKICKLYDVRS